MSKKDSQPSPRTEAKPSRRKFLGAAAALQHLNAPTGAGAGEPDSSAVMEIVERESGMERP